VGSPRWKRSVCAIRDHSPFRNANPHGNSYRNFNFNSDTNSNDHSDPYGNAYCHCYSHGDAHRDLAAVEHADRRRNFDTHNPANRYRDQNTRPNQKS
jgi:hypothetical protein